MIKENWKKFAALEFANSLGTNAPKIKIRNKLIQKEWNLFLKSNNLQKINYKLIYESCLNGLVFLGIRKIQNNIFVFSIGKPLSFEKIGNILLKLEVQVDEFNHCNNFFGLVEKWDITKNKKFIFEKYCKNLQTNEKIDFNNIINYFSKNETSFFSGIPYAPFYCNQLEEAELFNVNNELFNSYKTNLEILLTDSLVSKAITFLNTAGTSSDSKNINNLISALKDPKKIVFENRNLFSFLQNGGIQILQGASNGNGIIEKLKFYENKIKQFGFLKKETSDFGTKNLQKTETELLNNSADDYLESKANFFETQWEFFIRFIFVDYLINYKNLNIDNLNDLEINVEIMGSTKFLKNPENKYFQNQSGVLTNPNDFNYDNFFQKEINNGKEEK